jgi:hypothetical protein
MVPSVFTEKCSNAGTLARLRPDGETRHLPMLVSAVGIREDLGACLLIAQFPPPPLHR